MKPSHSVVFLLIMAATTFSTAQPETKKPGQPAWAPVWSDEFNAANGAAPDAGKWTLENSGNGFGNNELEYYTGRPQNARQENGNLVITAVQEPYTGPDGVSRQYTSARMKTEGKFSRAYGRFEARIKLPQGRGYWLAFWMLGEPCEHWPDCGEIDIMENVGSQPSTVLGTIHGPGYSGAEGVSQRYPLPPGQTVSHGFHVYAAEWAPNVIRFYVDDVLYATRTPADLPAGTRWIFDHPFFVILNLAVGGNLPGSPDDKTKFPQSMLVDYLRVYEHRRGDSVPEPRPPRRKSPKDRSSSNEVR